MQRKGWRLSHDGINAIECWMVIILLVLLVGVVCENSLIYTARRAMVLVSTALESDRAK